MTTRASRWMRSMPRRQRLSRDSESRPAISKSRRVIRNLVRRFQSLNWGFGISSGVFKISIGVSESQLEILKSGLEIRNLTERFENLILGSWRPAEEIFLGPLGARNQPSGFRRAELAHPSMEALSGLSLGSPTRVFSEPNEPPTQVSWSAGAWMVTAASGPTETRVTTRRVRSRRSTMASNVAFRTRAERPSSSTSTTTSTDRVSCSV